MSISMITDHNHDHMTITTITRCMTIAIFTRYWLMSSLLPGGDFHKVAHIFGKHYEMTSRLYRAFGAKIGKEVNHPVSAVSPLPTVDLLAF